MAAAAALLMMLTMASCGSGSDKDDGKSNSNAAAANNDEGKGSDEAKSSRQVTADEVRGHAETPASDLEYSEFDDGVLINGYNGSDDIVVIPAEINGKAVTRIESYFLRNNTNVLGLKLPASVKEIPDSGLSGQKSIQVLVAEGVEKVGESAFVTLPELRIVDFGNSLQSVQPNNFINCGNLESIHLPASYTGDILVNYIGNKVTIIGEKGSVAETFANENGLKFEEG
ncbi:MAG: leucine-rich repeat protein [Ruminococcus sp.]|nr:leucine-rich repeat protein [Ruminococcus sp.]